MGVYGLTGILQRYAPNAVRNVSCGSFARQSVAIDASCHLNKFIYGDEEHPFRHIYGFYLLARFCDLNNINPIFVFDGPTRLEAKQLEHAKRESQRSKVRHSLLIEKAQSDRLDNWLCVSNNELLISKESAITILSELGEKLEKIESTDNAKETGSQPPPLSPNPLLLEEEHREIETKLFQTAHELRVALETVENTNKYTRTVRDLVNRELELISEMVTNQDRQIKPALERLRKDNQTMLSSLEKRSIRITQGLRDECKDFLTTLGYICFTCDNHEAEAMCSHLAKAGRTTATVSEDMDTLVFGDVPILRYFFSKGRPILKIDPIIARQELGLSRKAFIDFCILCGTDFSGTIQGIGPHRALKAMRKYGSIEKLLENLDDKYVPQPTFNYQLAREVFNSLPPIPRKKKDYKKPSTSVRKIQKLLDYYQIDSASADLKLRMTILQQTIIDSESWGNDPFSQRLPSTISSAITNSNLKGIGNIL